MANEVTLDSEVPEQDSMFADPTPEEIGQVEEGETEQPDTVETAEPEVDPLEGTSFKSTLELAKAYKELQSTYTKSRQERTDQAALKERIKALLPNLMGKGENKQAPTREEIFNQFIADPVGFIAKQVEAVAGQMINQHVEPLAKDIGTRRLNDEVDSFLKLYNNNVTEAEEQAIIDYLAEGGAGSRFANDPERFDIAMSRLFPQKWAEAHSPKPKTVAKVGDKTLSDMKRSAGVGGKNVSTSKLGEPEDEMDAMVKRWHENFDERSRNTS